ncbi:N-acetyltransferase family protein [Phenylobacterium sp.]|uniref:GNAT family N-acetyltransferase n=1 Tax=Phenylobacterium sp. TaxID=1871053 RepID=UPI0035AE1611
MILRRASLADAGEIGRLHHRTMRTSLPFLPDLHTAAETEGFIAKVLMPTCELWVAEGEGRILGYVAFKPGWIDQLYVAPEEQGRGVGPALLAKALEDGSERRLWTFQKNARARAFYEQRGFRIETLTDGQDNEEREPDVLYVWRGENPAS